MKVPHRSEIYKTQETKGIDLRALETVYVDTCSATHRDGHDLNRYWIADADGDHVLVDRPYGQPENVPDARYMLLMVATVTFLTSLGAVRQWLKISTPADAEITKLVSWLETAVKSTEPDT